MTKKAEEDERNSRLTCSVPFEKTTPEGVVFYVFVQKGVLEPGTVESSSTARCLTENGVKLADFMGQLTEALAHNPALSEKIHIKKQAGYHMLSIAAKDLPLLGERTLQDYVVDISKEIKPLLRINRTPTLSPSR